MWSDERTARCTQLWREGVSAQLIARQLGGVSRNAVIGKMHRLGEHKRGPQTQRYGARLNQVKRKAKKARKSADGLVFAPVIAATPLPPEPPAPATLVAFDDLEPHHCRFVFGHPKSGRYGYCGCRRMPGSSYCEGHHHMVFRASEPRRRESAEKPTHLFRLYDTGSRKELEV